MLHYLIASAALFAVCLTEPRMDESKRFEPQFSFPPNNTPVSRVFVFGKPLYVRRPFVEPLREPLHVSVKRQSYGVDPYGAQPAQSTKYPLPQCYTNPAGFMCCNKDLEDLMDDVFDEMKKTDWKNCNTQKLANALQDKAQEKFGTDFESICSIGDFASKAHFYSDLICKTEKEGRYMLAYATPNRHNAPPAGPSAGPYFTVRI